MLWNSHSRFSNLFFGLGFTSRNAVWSSLMWLSGMCISSVSWSTNIPCLWLKVPRPTSCPLTLTLNPEKILKKWTSSHYQHSHFIWNINCKIIWIEFLTCRSLQVKKLTSPVGWRNQVKRLTLVQQWPKCQCLRCGPVYAPPILHLLQSPVYMSLLNIGMDFLQNKGSCLISWITQWSAIKREITIYNSFFFKS